MADSFLDIYRKAVLDTGIGNKDGRQTEAFNDFIRFFNGVYAEKQRQSMKYDAILGIFQEWWCEHHGMYS